MNSSTEVTALGRDLLLDDPWLAEVWLACAKKSTTEGDIALSTTDDGQITILFSEVFWSWPKAEQRLRLRHELLHLVLGHWAQANLFGQTTTFLIAADLLVTRLTQEPLPASLLPKTLPAEASLSSYYRFLRKHKKWQKAWQKEGNRLLRYRHWPSPGQQQRESLLEAGRLRTAATAALRQAATYGTEQGLQRIFLATATQNTTSTLPWRRILQAFLRQTGQTQLSHTHRRPSRRYGTTPGLRITRKLKLAVIVDTSASISPRQWRLFFREIERIKHAGASIQIIEADTVVQRTWTYHHGIPAHVTGGGGTLFDPAIRYAEAERPDALLYFTDGDGPVPVDWRGTPLLWLLTRPNDRLPGQQILLPTPEEVYLS